MPSPFLLVGAGLTGSSLALELASRGAEVLVLERAVPGAEASTKAAGILAPRVEAHGREPLRAMGTESLAMYPAWLERITALSGHAVPLARSGAIEIGDPGAPPDEDARWVDGGELRRQDPGLSPDLPGAWSFPTEGWVDPQLLTPAVHRAAEAAGARFRSGATVARVEPDGVLLTDGVRLPGTVVVCAGAWTGLVPGLAELPVQPVRGQLVALRGVQVPRVVFAEGGYFVPRADGRVVVGTTVERVGFTRGVTVAGLRSILDLAVRVYPGLAAAEVVESWSSFRPSTPDLMPALGALDGVWVDSGHHRNGILLAPLCAAWMADAVLEGRVLPTAVAPSRFKKL